MNPKVDGFIARETKWQAAFITLRTILLDCGLTEELKWGVPCYALEKTNIALIHGFKDYCAVLFMKGALLKDAQGVLIQQTENVQASRQIRFTDAAGVTELEPVVKAYVLEAIEIEKAGLKVPMKKTADFGIPEEFQRKLDEDPALKTAFGALTPGRQRAYLFYFAGAKQAKTREQRIEKSVPAILEGKGLDD